MNKIFVICIVGFLILSGINAVAFNEDKLNNNIEKQLYEKATGAERGYTHTVLAEVGTGSWCYWCQFTNAVLHDIYTNGDYNFEYVELVDSNPLAVERINDFNIAGYPTTWFDGGYGVTLGGYDTWDEYTTQMDLCGERPVPDIHAEMRVFWIEDEQIKVDISIQNNETTTYNGHIRAYIVENVSRWIDSGGKDYNHGFLDFAFDEDISIPGEEIFSDSTTWDGSSWNDPDLTMDNIMVILGVFNSEWHQGYSDPPSGNPFDAYYVDETISAKPGTSTPPEIPEQPEGPAEGVVGIEYDFTTRTTDPENDNIYYRFDWGDGTFSNWLGPYPTGDTVTGSHSWEYGGNYEIRVKARDDNGSKETTWSAPFPIYIAGGPELEIDIIKGGLFKVNTKIKNVGDLPAKNVTWNISLEEGTLILDGENNGIIDSIPVGEEVTISSNIIIGFGKTDVRVNAEIPDGPSDSRKQGARIFLIFIKVNVGGG
ncbi:hypothetical protein AYK21_02190 [Thermoplasmatales archaeon SG8-52-2]|nr:MAG: hypothetical protein AYK21_02190 [Thermoplasmatales archaeon SG8-52-2]